MKQAAGILPFRKTSDSIEVLIGHPGGPLFAKKDNGIWTIFKGELDDNEDVLLAAKREFEEETGYTLPAGELIDLGEAGNRNKNNHIWAIEADFDETLLHSNDFTMEWPPSSGKQGQFPEIDYGAWLTPQAAIVKLRPVQVVFIERLLERLGLPPLARPLQQPSLF